MPDENQEKSPEQVKSDSAQTKADNAQTAADDTKDEGGTKKEIKTAQATADAVTQQLRDPLEVDPMLRLERLERIVEEHGMRLASEKE